MLLSAISLALLIISSFSFTYMKPLDTISGPETKIPAFISTDATTIISPDSESSFLSFRTMFPTSPTPSPSTSISSALTTFSNFIARSLFTLS